MGYRLCMMVDSQNGPISGIFSFFFVAVFLHQLTLNDL